MKIIKIENIKNYKVVLPGCYMITNKINNKSYVGASENIYRRLRQHLYFSSNNELQNDFKKYGLENFRFKILEVTNDYKYKENYYIRKYKTINKGYNMVMGKYKYDDVGKCLN